MDDIRSIVETPIDWFDVIPKQEREKFRSLESKDWDRLARRTTRTLGLPMGSNSYPFRLFFFNRFQDELHDLLCSDKKYCMSRSEQGSSRSTGLANRPSPPVLP